MLNLTMLLSSEAIFNEFSETVKCAGAAACVTVMVLSVKPSAEIVKVATRSNANGLSSVQATVIFALFIPPEGEMESQV